MRTSKDAALSVSGKQNSMAFDVRSWQGLTELLKAGRNAGMSDDAYADFRDIVLRYAQSGGTDKALRTELERIMPTLTKKQVTEPVRSASVTSTPVQPVSGMAAEVTKASTIAHGAYAHVGMSRPKPVFGASVQKVSPKESAPAVSEEALQRVAHISFVPHNLPVASTEHTESFLKNVVAEVGVLDTTSPLAPVAPPVPTPPVAAPVQEPAPVVSPEPVRAPEPAPVVSRETKTVEEYRKRIADIKRTVNAEVGNPVMLIDAGNPIGREYMTALLNAMKATSGGAPGTLVSSMETLEHAFQKMLAAPKVASHDTPVAVVVPKAEEVPAPVISVEPEIVIDSTARWEGDDKVKETIVQSTPSPLPSLKDQIDGVTATPLPEIEVEAAEIPEVQQAMEPEVVPVPASPVSESIVLHAENTTPALHADVSKHLAKGVGQAHLDVTIPGDTKQEPPESVKEDLRSPEMDIGLNQLLSEWKIFRGSGLFGTGPGGVEHPLYLKLKDMPMSLVSSGSWEKASKEDVVSIRDYTNGWRHEQGISFVPSESFETYLRRVVKRVLKRQGI